MTNINLTLAITVPDFRLVRILSVHIALGIIVQFVGATTGKIQLLHVG